MHWNIYECIKTLSGIRGERDHLGGAGVKEDKIEMNLKT
jgi:hypothetical protein